MQAGKLHHAACVVRPGQYFVRRLLQLIGLHLNGGIGRRRLLVREDEEKGGAEHVFGLPPEFTADVAWWRWYFEEGG